MEVFYVLYDSDRRAKAASIFKFSDVPSGMAVAKIEGDMPGDMECIDDYKVSADCKLVRDSLPADFRAAGEHVMTLDDLAAAVIELGSMVAEMAYGSEVQNG